MTFRVEGNYVEIDAVVTDSRGAFVRDLKPDEFQIVEDKKPRPVDVFTLVDIPIERPDAPLYRKNPVEPDVVTNEKPDEGRLYVIVLDGNHTPATDTALVKRAALQFVDQALGANDQAAVVLLQTTSAKANQEFTADKSALRAAVGRFSGEKVQWKAINVMEQITLAAGAEERSRSTRGPRSPGARARPQGRRHARRADQPVAEHVRHPRTKESHCLLQRGPRLQHRRHHWASGHVAA